jgi:hypothetical protein
MGDPQHDQRRRSGQSRLEAARRRPHRQQRESARLKSDRLLEDVENCRVNPQLGGTILSRRASTVLISVLASDRLQISAASGTTANVALLTVFQTEDMPDGDWRAA